MATDPQTTDVAQQPTATDPQTTDVTPGFPVDPQAELQFFRQQQAKEALENHWELL